VSTSRRAAWFVAASLTTLLTACGGGGGNDDKGGGTPPPPAATTYQLSGQIRIPQNTLVDSDVNDPLAPYASNDSIATAQALPNPANLAGYVNEKFTGPVGRSQAPGDLSDVFRIDAVKGQVVSLVVGDPSAGDVDLYLYDSAGGEVAYSINTGKLESIEIAASGRYYVEVSAYEGASNYVLMLGQPTGAAAASTLSSTSEFVPGEAVVRWRSAASPARAGARSTAQALAAHGLSRVAGAADGDWLVRLDQPAASLAQARGKASALGAQSTRTPTTGALSLADSRKATLAAIKRLRADPDVEYAEPNYIRRALATTPNDEFYPLQWHYPLINLPAAWDITTGSNSVVVAVVDTGVLLAHPDLQGQLVAGYDFISDATRAGDGDGIDANPNDPGDADSAAGGSSFHGTHVAGTIAAASNNGLGVAGVAWKARVMPVRVLGKGGTGSSFDINQGVLFAARLANASGTLPAKRADIINLSLGGAPFSQAEQNMFNQVRAAGVIVVAAAGNEANAVLSYPASYDGVVSVSAVAIDKSLASYSSYGSKVDIAAPGGDAGDANGDGYVDRVLSTRADDSSGQFRYTYTFLNGTSMAAPHVAGVFALMKSVNANLTPADIDTLLAAGRLTVDIGAPGRDDKFGHGLIDALKAVQAAQNGTGTVPGLVVATPTALNFAPGISSLGFTASNGGGQAASVTQVQVSQGSDWLAVVSPAAANGLGAYTVQVNRGTRAPGAYNATIRLLTSANTVDVSVVMQVGATGTPTASDLGQHYILLVDPDTLEGRYQVTARAVGGAYAFSFPGVAAGKYKLVAGSDADNNGSICDAAEACSAYLSLDSPALIVANANRNALDFDGGYWTSLTANAAGRAPAAPPFRVKRLPTEGGTP
jgi:serine protease